MNKIVLQIYNNLLRIYVNIFLKKKKCFLKNIFYEFRKLERMEEQDLVESSDTDMRDKKVGYKINRKMEKSIAKDEADMKKVRVPLMISSLSNQQI